MELGHDFRCGPPFDGKVPVEGGVASFDKARCTHRCSRFLPQYSDGWLSYTTGAVRSAADASAEAPSAVFRRCRMQFETHPKPDMLGRTLPELLDPRAALDDSRSVGRDPRPTPTTCAARSSSPDTYFIWARSC